MSTHALMHRIREVGSMAVEERRTSSDHLPGSPDARLRPRALDCDILSGPTVAATVLLFLPQRSSYGHICIFLSPPTSDANFPLLARPRKLYALYLTYAAVSTSFHHYTTLPIRDLETHDIVAVGTHCPELHTHHPSVANPSHTKGTLALDLPRTSLTSPSQQSQTPPSPTNYTQRSPPKAHLHPYKSHPRAPAQG